MEALHGNNCPKMEQHRRREARREAFRQELEQWRRADRERLRKARGVPIRKRSAPLPPHQPHVVTLARLERLSAALADPARASRSHCPGRPAGRSVAAGGRWRLDHDK
jgi:hypothetical protein